MIASMPSKYAAKPNLGWVRPPKRRSPVLDRVMLALAVLVFAGAVFALPRVSAAWAQCSDFGARTMPCFVNDVLTGEDL
jgi:hypothetical protein